MADSDSVDKRVEGESYDISEVPGDEGASGGQHVGLSDENDCLDDELYGTASKQKVGEPSFETTIDDGDEIIDNTAKITMNKCTQTYIPKSRGRSGQTADRRRDVPQRQSNSRQQQEEPNNWRNKNRSFNRGPPRRGMQPSFY